MDRERQTNPGDKGRLVTVNLPERQRHDTSKKCQQILMETCSVCGGSFKKGRGLSVHKTKSKCGALEKTRKMYKSRKGSPPDENHSGSTKEELIPSSASPEETSRKEENVKKEQRSPNLNKDMQCIKQQNNNNALFNIKKPKPKKQQTLDSILVVDDEVKRTIKESVLRENGGEVTGTSTSFSSAGSCHFSSAKHQNPKKELKGDKALNCRLQGKNNSVKSRDIRSFICISKQPSLLRKDQAEETTKIEQGSISPRRNVVLSQESSKIQNKELESKIPIQDIKQEVGIPRRSVILNTPTRPDFIQVEESPPKTSNQCKVADPTNQMNDIRQFLTTGPSLEKGPSEEYKELIRNLNSGPPDDVLSKHTIQMRRRDYRTLTGTNFLNDKIIDEYLTMIKERNQHQKDLPSIYTFPSYVFPHLRNDFSHFEYIENRIKTDLTLLDIVLIPIHYEQHWSLVAVEIQERKIKYYDSIYGSQKRSSGPRTFKNFFEKYFEMKGITTKFIIEIVENAPLQGNGYDCGVFVCQNAEKIARKVFVNTKQKEMGAARKKMIEEIHRGRLIEESSQCLKDFTMKTGYLKKDKKTSNSEPNRQEDKTNKPKRQLPKKEPSHHNGKEPKEETTSRKDRINWPKSNSKEWERLDTDLSELLKTIYSPAEKKSISHPKIIYNMCKERFGVKENKDKHKISGPSRRQRKCEKLRQQIKTLKETYFKATEEEKPAINELQKDILQKLRIAKRAESLRKNRKKYSSNCHQFLSQPFKFAREVVAPKPKGELKSTKEVVENHLREVHSKQDSSYNNKLENLNEYPSPVTDFNDNPPSFKEFQTKLRKTRSGSAPGPNGVPYVVYKRCPGVAKQLWHYLKDLWKKNKICKSWQEAEGVFIPKEEGASTIDKFRTISLLNVEGKLFFSMKADRITQFLMINNLINPSIQKGGIPGVSGCLEHTSILSQLIREAKSEKKNLVVTWLDIANAYGSIPHDVIKVGLEKAHIPEKTRNLIDSYYSNAKIRFTTKNFRTEWQRVERGIITGCTLSVVLFALTMSFIVESVIGETKGPKTTSGQRQANSRLFMDDISTTTETVPQTKHLLEKLIEKLNWAGLTVKAEKCRSLIIYKGKVITRSIMVNGMKIKSILEQPIKHLGKKYTSDLDEKQQIELIKKQLKQDLRKVEKCQLPGRFKCWILQHMIIPRMMWPLSIYNIAMTKVEELQKTLTSALKRWLRIPKSFSKECMYSKTSKLRLPFTSLEEEFKAAKARNLVTMEASQDPCIRNAKITVDKGIKQNTPAEIKEAKERLQMEEITGIPNKGREGIGFHKRKYYSSCSQKEKRDLVVGKVKEKEEEKRVVAMTGFSNQGAHLRWEVPQRRLRHRDIINTPDAQLTFLIKAVHDLLPTPANKKRWFKREEKCILCGEEGTLHHILSACKVALSQGRYKWRHDKVLREISTAIRKRVAQNITANDHAKSTSFVKEGQKVDRNLTRKGTLNYLSSAKDWEVMVDLDGQVKVPEDITITNLRPDILLISQRTKQLGIIELTVPSEERIEISGQIKRMKYEAIAQEGRLNGWRIRIWSLEVGCKGFPAISVSSFFKDIGYPGGLRRKIIENIGKSAEQASHTLWKSSFYKNWGSK